MLYKEFEERLEELGLYAEYLDYNQIVIHVPLQSYLAVIDDNHQYDVYFSDRCKVLSPTMREKLFKLAFEYVSTPLDERRIKKYKVVACRLKFGSPENMLEDVKYYYRDDKGCLSIISESYLSDSDENQQWTTSQIKEYGLEDNERIEVEQ